MYRLNASLPDAIGQRLNEMSASTGQTKVAIVCAALDDYLKRQEVQQKLLEKMSDPEIFAKMCSAIGVDFSQFNQQSEQ